MGNLNELEPSWHYSPHTSRVFVVVAAAALGLAAGLAPVAVAALVGGTLIGVLFVTRPLYGLAGLLALGGFPLGALTGGNRSVLSAAGGTTAGGLILVLSIVFIVTVLSQRRVLVAWLARFWPHTLWVSWSVASLIYTDSLDDGLRLAAKLLYPLLVMCLASEVIRTEDDLTVPFKGWIAGVALASFIALARLVVVGLPMLAQGGAYRYTALMHPSPFSFFLIVSFMTAFALWRLRGGRFLGVASLILAVQVLMTLVRISIAGLVVAMALIEAARSRGAAKWMRALLVGVVMVAVMTWLVLQSPILQRRVTYERVTGAGDLLSLTRLDDSGRGSLWSQLFEEYAHGDKAFGSGLGSSTPAVIRFARGADVGVVHNEYLRLLYETGLVGLLAFLFMLLWHFLRLRAHARVVRARPLVVAATGALLIYALVSVTDNALDYYDLFGQYVFFLVGAVWGLARNPRAGQVELGRGVR